ncbi:maleylpyruvate isomerase family mycothiol-dependent enzyme [Actinomycetospora endophytica]|uniref:Maleylpyruvate isomerase family mycothiol-dependent enzyme n=1 Tax=Actinomycetospora endophytica TaxID=2291215 RepID=A0ABS8P8C0_9PSEU|nr:maleylpyruvate isomerase family mycothiol-dependent enzyme [Actinomycetospora endophytica]MCD2194532.1 maleylpyruvate isomerase family mycothiol-dependent enzyme [Actinomycetospora endophytica]
MPSTVDLLPPTVCLDHLDSATARFSTALAGADLAAPVPSCPPWSLRELAHHLGGVHRWARVAVLEGHPNGTSDDPPSSRADLVAWFDEGSAALISTLREAGPDAPCWSFGPKPRTAAFWFRRQAHETAMHAHDAEVASGTAGALASDFALDGLDEAIAMFLPRQVRLGRCTVPDVRIAVASAEGPSWEIAGDGAPERPAATVRGDAEALLLLVWGRVGPDDARVDVEGDRGAVDAVLAAGLTP